MHGLAWTTLQLLEQTPICDSRAGGRPERRRCGGDRDLDGLPREIVDRAASHSTNE